jgi:hypothetical protein
MVLLSMSADLKFTLIRLKGSLFPCYLMCDDVIWCCYIARMLLAQCQSKSSKMWTLQILSEPSFFKILSLPMGHT